MNRFNLNFVMRNTSADIVARRTREIARLTGPITELQKSIQPWLKIQKEIHESMQPWLEVQKRICDTMRPLYKIQKGSVHYVINDEFFKTRFYHNH